MADWVRTLDRLPGLSAAQRAKARIILSRKDPQEASLLVCGDPEVAAEVIRELLADTVQKRAGSPSSGDVLKKARFTGSSASRIAQGTNWYRHAWNPKSPYEADDLSEAGFFGFRPEASPPANIPAELVAPEFGHILRAAEQAALPPKLAGTDVSFRELYGAVLELFKLASRLNASEQELQDQFLAWHNSMLGVGNMPRPRTSASARHYGGTPHDGKLTAVKGEYIVALMESKRDGGSGVPLVQALRYYQQHYNDGDTWDKSPKAQADTLPALVLLLEGPYLSIYAVWTIYLNRVGYAPLTPSYVLANETSCCANVWRLMAVLDAYCKAAKELRKRYDDLASKSAGSEDIVRQASLRKAACVVEKNGAQQELPCTLPYCLLKEDLALDDIRFVGPRLLYRATMGQGGGGGRRLVLVKFVDGEYGQQVHEAWHRAGLAPELYCVRQVGAIKMVVMEELRAEHGWEALSAVRVAVRWQEAEKEKKDAVRAAVTEALDRAHQVVLPCGGRAAHGDVRGPNVLVRNIYDQEKAEVRFIDFDWAGVDGTATYPPILLNPYVSWHPDVHPGRSISQGHDKHLLERELPTN